MIGHDLDSYKDLATSQTSRTLLRFPRFFRIFYIKLRWRSPLTKHIKTTDIDRPGFKRRDLRSSTTIGKPTAPS